VVAVIAIAESVYVRFNSLVTPHRLYWLRSNLAHGLMCSRSHCSLLVNADLDFFFRFCFCWYRLLYVLSGNKNRNANNELL